MTLQIRATLQLSSSTGIMPSSFRYAGLRKSLRIEGENFQVGVGHLIVDALLESCNRFVRVDATNPASQYIFKSLGFRHDDLIRNPCILILNQ